MIRRLALLVSSIILFSACSSSAPSRCAYVQSDHWAVDSSWLTKRVDDQAARRDTAAFARVMENYREGDEVWTFRAPVQPAGASAVRTANAERMYGIRANGHRVPPQRGYVLMRDCQAVALIPSNAAY